MKTYATAVMNKVEQEGIESYDITLQFQVPEIGLDIDLVPFVEKMGKSYKKLSNIEEYVLNEIKKRTDGINIRGYNDSGSSFELDPISSMSYIIDIFFSALHKCSSDGRKPFHVNIQDPMGRIKEYGEKWKDMMDKLNTVENGVPEPKDDVDTKLNEILRLLNLPARANVVTNIQTTPVVREVIQEEVMDLSDFNTTSSTNTEQEGLPTGADGMSNILSLLPTIDNDGDDE